MRLPGRNDQDLRFSLFKKDSAESDRHQPENPTEVSIYTRFSAGVPQIYGNPRVCARRAVKLGNFSSEQQPRPALDERMRAAGTRGGVTGHQLNYLWGRSASGAWKRGFWFRIDIRTPLIQKLAE